MEGIKAQAGLRFGGSRAGCGAGRAAHPLSSSGTSSAWAEGIPGGSTAATGGSGRGCEGFKRPPSPGISGVKARRDLKRLIRAHSQGLECSRASRCCCCGCQVWGRAGAEGVSPWLGQSSRAVPPPRGLQLGVFVCAELPLAATAPGVSPGLGTAPVPLPAPLGAPWSSLPVPARCVWGGQGRSGFAHPGQKGPRGGGAGALQGWPGSLGQGQQAGQCLHPTEPPKPSRLDEPSEEGKVGRENLRSAVFFQAERFTCGTGRNSFHGALEGTTVS